MIRRGHTTKRQVIDALTSEPTLLAAAHRVGLHDHTALRGRMRRLKIDRIKRPEFLIITVRP